MVSLNIIFTLVYMEFKQNDTVPSRPALGIYADSGYLKPRLYAQYAPRCKYTPG